MIRILVCFVTVFFCVVPVNARTVELTLSPAKASEAAKKFQLLPTAGEQTDSDALPLYRKAVELLPQDLQRDKIDQWLKMPPKDLPLEQVKSTLDQFSSTLELLKQAGLSKGCNWPAGEIDAGTEDLSRYRQAARILAVQTRLQIAQGLFDQAFSNIRTGIALARHLGEAPTLIHGLVGVAIGALMCKQVEEVIQYPDAPTFYWALQSLPKPLIDLNRQIELELANLKKQDDVLRRQQEEQLKPGHDRVRVIGKRFDRDVAALQCIEAIRLHAATHGGKFPNQLSDITDVAVPNNPATGIPFVYRRSGSKATLEGLSPGDSQKEEVLRYELNLKE
jgi:tetratricopeptide (TPR) repeat protein